MIAIDAANKRLALNKSEGCTTDQENLHRLQSQKEGMVKKSINGFVQTDFTTILLFHPVQ
jgi:hypothetical protein